MHIKIMGPGCHNCQKVAKLVQESAVAAGVDVQVKGY
jgi:hypothetical protein